MKIYVIVLLSVLSGVAYSDLGKECVKASDCELDECCVIGMSRYSYPSCQPMGQIGDTCLMYNEPEDKELYYPNRKIKYYGIYRLFCPCSKPLRCKNAQCSA